MLKIEPVKTLHTKHKEEACVFDQSTVAFKRKDDLIDTKTAISINDYVEENSTDEFVIYEESESDESSNFTDTDPKLDLERHTLKSQKRRKRTFCTICGKFLNNFAEHKRMHLNIRKQQCPYCGKTFVHRSNLYSHLNIHTKERVYKCQHCDSEFNSVQGLKQHLLTHFEGQYTCTTCNRKYGRKSYLRIHQQRVHMPKQKHKCMICDREFHDLLLKEKHMKIHNNAALHECIVCRRAYNAKRNLLRHIRMAHPTE